MNLVKWVGLAIVALLVFRWLSKSGIGNVLSANVSQQLNPSGWGSNGFVLGPSSGSYPFQPVPYQPVNYVPFYANYSPDYGFTFQGGY